MKIVKQYVNYRRQKIVFHIIFKKNIFLIIVRYQIIPLLSNFKEGIILTFVKRIRKLGEWGVFIFGISQISQDFLY